MLGVEWKEGTNRIGAHTDETLITLLFTQPGAPCGCCCRECLA